MSEVGNYSLDDNKNDLMSNQMSKYGSKDYGHVVGLDKIVKNSVEKNIAFTH